jgi:hypothetical protein
MVRLAMESRRQRGDPECGVLVDTCQAHSGRECCEMGTQGFVVRSDHALRHRADAKQASYWPPLAMTAMSSCGCRLSIIMVLHSVPKAWKIRRHGGQNTCADHQARRFTIWHGLLMPRTSSLAAWTILHGSTMLAQVRSEISGLTWHH